MHIGVTANTNTAHNPNNPQQLKQLFDLAKNQYRNNDPQALASTIKLAERSLKAEQMDMYADANELLGRIYIYTGNISKAEDCFKHAFEHWESMRDSLRISFLYSYLGEVNFVRCNYKDAEYFYLKSLDIKKARKDTSNFSYSYNALGNVEFEKCQYHKALQWYNKALDLNTKYNNVRGECYTYNALGNIYFEINDLATAKKYFQKALNIGKEYELAKNIAYSLNQLAIIENKKGNRNTAINLYTESLETSKELSSKNGIARSYLGMGEVFQSMGQNDKALEYYHKSLKLFEELDSKKNIAQCHENIGNVIYMMREFEDARESYKKAREINLEIGYLKGVASCHRRIGNSYYQEKKYEACIPEYKKSIKIQKSIKNLKGVAAAYSNLGLIYTHLDSLKLAEQKFDQALKINKEIDNWGGIGSVYNNLATLYQAKGQEEQSIHYLLNSLDIAKRINRTTLMAENARNLSDAYQKQKKYRLSLHYFQMYFDLYNQLYSAQAENRIGWIQMKNEREKRDNMVRILSNEKAMKEEKLQKQNLINTFLIIIVLLVFAFIGFGYKIYKELKKAHKDLSVENEERKKAETLLEDHQKNLESLVKIRTLELLKSKEKAEQSDRLKSAFLANMSHEIRTPMNAIIGFSKLMGMTDSSEKHQYFTKIINDNGQILLTLVNDIIDISMIESQQLKIKKSNFMVYPILSELKIIFEEQKKELQKEHLSFNLNVPDKLKQVSLFTDHVRLKQVLINLLRNAFKFTEDGSIDLGLEVTEDHLRFYVKDTGIGIPVEEQKLVYERFRQASNNSPKHGGTGLGLTISKSLVQLLDGHIWFNSIPGAGSTFYIEFPIQDQPIFLQKEKRVCSKGVDFSGKNILVAEDIESNFLYINEVLKKVNANVTWSQDGLETVEKFKDDHFDLVLMDIQLPKINGYQATREIKKQDPNIPVVVQSAYALQTENRKMFESGCDAFIAKPYTEEQLLTIIQENMS
jgi:signal transduction histidine kinase/uncharacterized protein HemY